MMMQQHQGNIRCAPRLAPAHSLVIPPYLHKRQLAEVTPWTIDAIDKRMKRGFFKENVHYFRPCGGREVIFKWEAVVGLIECTQLENQAHLLLDTDQDLSLGRTIDVVSEVEEDLQKLLNRS